MFFLCLMLSISLFDHVFFLCLVLGICLLDHVFFVCNDAGYVLHFLSKRKVTLDTAQCLLLGGAALRCSRPSQCDPRTEKFAHPLSTTFSLVTRVHFPSNSDRDCDRDSDRDSA